MTALSEMLGHVMWRAGVGAQTLSKLTGIPRTAIDNWREGTVRRPRHWRPLLQIARVLSLSRDQADDLLAAAGYPAVGTLAVEVPQHHPDRAHLFSWLHGSPVAVEPAPTAWCQLRAPAADFTGRGEALQSLVEALRGVDRDAVAAVAGIRGMGGVGKTELALLVASRVRDSYPDAQLVVQLRGVHSEPVSPTRALRQVIHVFSPELKLAEDLDALQQQYCAVLSGRRVLILADDAGDAAQVRPLLPPAGSALLVTSRHRFTLPGMACVDLAGLPEPEAVRMLRAICGRISDAEALAITRACGCLPLALRISGSMLANDPALPVPEYVAALADWRVRPARLRDPDDDHLDLAASLGLSCSRLDAVTGEVFRQLGVFAADFGAELAAAVIEGDVPDSLRLLLRRNLIGFDPARRRWQLHDLVRDMSRQALDAQGATAAVMWRYAQASLRIAEEIQQDYGRSPAARPEALARFDAERSHVDAARQWAAEHAGSQVADQMLVADATAIYRQIGAMRYDRRGEIAPQALSALAAAQRLGDRRVQRLMLNRLGLLHLDLGDIGQGVAYFEQGLIFATSGDGKADEVCAMNNLGLALLRLGDPRSAIELHERQLILVRELADMRGEGMARCNLAAAYVRLGAGRRALDELVLADELVARMNDPLGVASTLATRGLAHLLLGEPAAAGASFERLLTVLRDLGDRGAEAKALADLGRVAVRQGRVEAGIALAAQGLAITVEIGSLHAESYALRALAEGRAVAGDRAGAVEALQRAWKLLRGVGDRGDEAECSWELGAVLLDDDPQRAVELMGACIRYQQKIGYGPGDAQAHNDGQTVLAQTLALQAE